MLGKNLKYVVSLILYGIMLNFFLHPGIALYKSYSFLEILKTSQEKNLLFVESTIICFCEVRKTVLDIFIVLHSLCILFLLK